MFTVFQETKIEPARREWYARMQAIIDEEDITESDSDANSSHSTEDALVSPDL